MLMIVVVVVVDVVSLQSLHSKFIQNVMGIWSVRGEKEEKRFLSSQVCCANLFLLLWLAYNLLASCDRAEGGELKGFRLSSNIRFCFITKQPVINMMQKREQHAATTATKLSLIEMAIRESEREWSEAENESM